MQVVDASENVRFLRRRFLERLLAERPESVLDVGCGGGALLRSLGEAGVRAAGVEADERRVHAAREAGLDVTRGAGEKLPAEDGAWDWVTMRHVPHHLEDPAAAFAEAWRVCRTGVLIAEPWYETGIANQRVALEADRWIKRGHRRGGLLHADILDADALLTLFPSSRDWEADIETALRLRARSAEDLAAEAVPLMAGLPEDHGERAAFAAILDAVARDGLSWNGSLLVTVRVSAPDRPAACSKP